MSTKNTQAIAASPQKIRQQLLNAREICDKLACGLDNVDRKVASSAYFWKSDSAVLLRKYFNEDKPAFEQIKRELRSQIEKLEQIAEQYESAETSASEQAATLPDTIID